MKYSLRSMMIAVTLVCVALGAVVAWQSHSQFCLNQANAHEAAYRIVVSGGSYVNMSQEEVAAAQAEMWERIARENKIHERLEKEYRLAVWRPWMRFWIIDEVAP
ncbi:MAG: hypothetical protein ACKVP0_05350 [Pirellulaceae bacterium]